MKRPRWILHADMDAFYASIEQRDHPEFRDRPVIVGGNSPRGVVAAASYEARRFGVRSAMPGFRARELCPDAIFLPADIERYAEVSRQVHAVFEQFTPAIEPLALDEAFLDVTESVHLFGDVEATARQLKQRVLAATGLIVSVGAAPSKLVAKIACALSKPDGLVIVPPERVRPLLEPLPVGRLWGVGPVLVETLQGLGILSIGDLARSDAGWLERSVGSRASVLQEMARGVDDRPVESQRQAKSYGEESTFEQDIVEREDITDALTVHCEVLARRLRRDRIFARTISIKIKLGRAVSDVVGRTGAQPHYPLLTRARTLRAPIQEATELRRVAIELWDDAAVTEPVRLLGVSVSRVERQASEQLDLFADKRKSCLDATVDLIQQRFGEASIGSAVALSSARRAPRAKPRG